MMVETDFLIVGAGIAGASIAYRLAANADVMLVEMESQADYHTTGRSAAFYAETYGGPYVQPLTSASKDFFLHPPEGFRECPLIHELGAIHLIRTGQEAEARILYEDLKKALPNVAMLTRAEVLAKAPQLDVSDIMGGIFDADCKALDVAALHQGFLREAKRAGARVHLDTKLEGGTYEADCWHVKTNQGLISAKTIINASGAWSDTVAECMGVIPLGLQPLRRTIVTIKNPEGLASGGDSPIIMEVGKEHYFKPEGQGYLLTPGDEVLAAASDVQPEAEDIALAVQQFEQATASTVKTVGAKWAGLRTFATDRAPIIGFAPDNDHFFWSVGQGGFGIQTAPAWSELAAALLTKGGVPRHQHQIGVRAAYYDPARFSQGVF
ncbi:MAG: FAD-binding oxidoreductase [Kordiimonadaceae bacterium]|nr:FAD-binding oxidoreductase [Kordiimonadaceae bacterium]